MTNVAELDFRKIFVCDSFEIAAGKDKKNLNESASSYETNRFSVQSDVNIRFCCIISSRKERGVHYIVA